MSYILDALKKSESERGHGAIPGVQTVHSSSINYHQQKKPIWPYFLIAAVALNILVIAYFIYTQNASSQSTLLPVVKNNPPLISPTKSPSNSAVETIVKSPVNTTPVKPPLVASTVQKPQATTLTHTPTIKEGSLENSPYVREQIKDKPATARLIEPPAKPSVIAAEQILEQNELPENIQRQLPALVISAHVYSSNPSQRSLIVNNEFFEEGDYIMDDIILHEITSDGAIFNYNGLLFHNRSVSGWQ